MAEHGYGHLRRGRCDCVEGECAGSGRRDGMARTTKPPRIRSSTTCKVAKVVALAFSEGKRVTCDVCRFYVSCASLPGRAHIGILTAKRLPRLHKGQVRVAKGGGEGGVSRSCAFLVSACFVSLFLSWPWCALWMPRACTPRHPAPVLRDQRVHAHYGLAFGKGDMQPGVVTRAYKNWDYDVK